MKPRLYGLAGLIVLGACTARNSEPSQTPANNSVVETPASPSAPVRPAIDPKSTEAAVQRAKAFVDLLNRGRFDEAWMLMSSGAPPRTDFTEDFSRYSHLRATTGSPGDQEGAAGSIYLSVPLTVSGKIDRRDVSRSGSIVMRRVNDVPGSTEKQRQWHIERIDWAS
jgi:hypothetical protein